jgi:hypothetical protein
MVTITPARFVANQFLRGILFVVIGYYSNHTFVDVFAVLIVRKA